jgi:hypothetical protein
MFLDENNDYLTVWKLAHNWANVSPDNSDPSALPNEVKQGIHRTLSAIANRAITARNRKKVIFADEDTFEFLFFEIFNYLKLLKVQRKSVYDKSFLDSVYVKRAEVLRWCQNDFLDPPPIWQLSESNSSSSVSNDNDDEDEETSWYDSLTPKRKQKVACLELAKKLWKINPEWSYEEVFRHSIMKQYGNPEVFTLRSFKEWAREFAPETAKIGGRPKASNTYEQLKKR